MLSTAIILPEQSVASDKAGLAVSKKGLTLKELLQQTSHHNAKVRKGTVSISFKHHSCWILNFVMFNRNVHKWYTTIVAFFYINLHVSEFGKKYKIKIVAVV